MHYSLPPRPPLPTLERRQRQWGTKRSRLKRLTLDNAAFLFFFSHVVCMPNFAFNCVLNLNHNTCSHRTKFHRLLLFFASFVIAPFGLLTRFSWETVTDSGFSVWGSQSRCTFKLLHSAYSSKAQCVRLSGICSEIAYCK